MKGKEQIHHRTKQWVTKIFHPSFNIKGVKNENLSRHIINCSKLNWLL
jgi:hypothetical protein